MEALWMEGDNLAALVSTDAEFDHFEAVRDEYEALLNKFIAAAAHDEMAAITELTAKVAYSASGVLAFEGATLIDGSGRPALANATVLVSNGNIVSARPAGHVKIPADQDLRLGQSGKRESRLRRRAPARHDGDGTHTAGHDHLPGRGLRHGPDQPHQLHLSATDSADARGCEPARAGAQKVHGFAGGRFRGRTKGGAIPERSRDGDRSHDGPDGNEFSSCP